MAFYDIPEQYRDAYKVAMTGKAPKIAIAVHCLMCMGWESREAVKECTAPNCPLYPYRNTPLKLSNHREKAGLKKGPLPKSLIPCVNDRRETTPKSHVLDRDGLRDGGG